MKETMVLLSLVFAGATGIFGGAFLHERIVARRRAKDFIGRAGVGSLLEALHVNLECEGLSRYVLASALSLSRKASEGDRPCGGARGLGRLEGRVVKAGLEGLVNDRGIRGVRLRASVLSSAACLCAGSILSPLMAFVLGSVGFFLGWRSIDSALKEEMDLRVRVAEQQLSQMIEVVVLGLQSGMSFDESLSLYHRRFSGSLAQALSSAQSQWVHGFVSRDEGLHKVARSYDSPLFERFAENVIRSLRFGTSLADGLNALALEARSVRKAKLEERVAKAPVKMLLPVGTLILPAMLVLVLGPIMLELMMEL